jgi:hypothetical protein
MCGNGTNKVVGGVWGMGDGMGKVNGEGKLKGRTLLYNLICGYSEYL